MNTSGNHAGTMRLLPWTSSEGKPCYLVNGDGGKVSQAADSVEAVQLGMAGDLMRHAAVLLADRKVSAGELRYLAGRLNEALCDVSRVARSRGDRLAVPVCDGWNEPPEPGIPATGFTSATPSSTQDTAEGDVR